MVNYGKSMIYKLCCKDPNIINIYIGSTTNFSRRKSQHKNTCNDVNSNDYNLKNYQFIRDNGGFDNFDMILIENVSCNSKIELLKIERKYIDELKPSLNSITSYLTEEEKQMRDKKYRKVYGKKYREKNKTEILEKQTKNREDNKQEINEKQNQKINCEFCNCLIGKTNMKRHQHTIKCMKFQFIED